LRITGRDGRRRHQGRKTLRRKIMARRVDFWTNGITTILQSPENAQRLERRTDLGTVVEQNANTASWFHIPLTTPTILEDDATIFLRRCFLRARVYENATVDVILIRRGTDLIVNLNVNFTNTTIQSDFNGPDQMMGGDPQAGLAMSILVRFLTGTPRGRVEFQGAGAQFS
jgi:hypothetical protein